MDLRPPERTLSGGGQVVYTEAALISDVAGATGAGGHDHVGV